MRVLATEVKIAAPMAKVWQTLMDFEHWHEWNPTVKQAGGQAEIDAVLSITMSRDDCQEVSYQPRVYEIQPPHLFRWRATMMAGFLFTNDRVFELREEGGVTTLSHREEFAGIMAVLWWGKLSQFVIPILEKMNTALKKKLEVSP
ncbi:MAG: SRPBCC domain-containing protein [Zetaproteobacteria bacterium]|nr:SRPBCC domain-containing protein [Zetaproteobacteria bacterium]